MHKEQKWCYLYNIVLNNMYVSNCHYVLYIYKQHINNYLYMKNLLMYDKIRNYKPNLIHDHVIYIANDNHYFI